MPIVGNLSEFPLPEVLLLIGARTGSLRLFEVPSYGMIAIDLSEGQAHALHLGSAHLTAPDAIVAELSVIVEAGAGMFEFRAQPVESVRQGQPLEISYLVMKLVLHVDEKLARQRTLMARDLFYRLETPVPDIWIDPILNEFFEKCRPHLAEGIQSEELATELGLDNDAVRLNLDHLRQVGIIKVLDGIEIEQNREAMLKEKISKKTSAFQLAAEASDLIKRTGKLLKLPPREKY